MSLIEYLKRETSMSQSGQRPLDKAGGFRVYFKQQSAERKA